MRTGIAALLLIGISSQIPGSLRAQSGKATPVETASVVIPGTIESSGTGGGGAATSSAPATAIQMVTQSVAVKAEDASAFQAESVGAHITMRQIVSAAGTFGDFTRYLQVLPGVVGNTDLSNEVLVRGGHPTENLFVVDGIEIPNINHFSLSGSTGGFTSMIDSSAVGSIDFKSDVYDASYSSRLSSLIQLQTRPLGEHGHDGEFTVGISGAGGLYQRSLGHKSSLLLSAHRSIINLVTNDVGINGVPIYTNALTQFEWSPREEDKVSVLSLSGSDSISMDPCASDPVETSDVQTQYSGWRSTEGLVWDHIFLPSLTSKLTASTSITRQKISQQQQIGYVSTCEAAELPQVYTENSHDDATTLGYQVQRDVRGWLVSAGASGKLTALNDLVQQPIGEQSPFSIDPKMSDATQFNRRISTGQTAAFLEAEGSLGARWKLLAGVRAETFAIDGSHALDPRISAAYKLNRYQTVHVSWGISSQLPPTTDLLSYAINQHLRPVQVRQEAAGIRLFHTDWGTFDAGVYEKQYSHEAVCTEYPQLALNNMIDTLGQQFLWLPLTSKGTAAARGLELSLHAHWHDRLSLVASGTYSRGTYRALDGMSRRSNYDVPLSTNVMANVRLPRGFALNVRETATSGRLYTPFDMAASLAQNRGIYDLTQVNGARSSLYTRLDPELQKEMHLGRGIFDLHAGVENLLDRQNFLGYVWATNCEPTGVCASKGGPVVRVPQIGRYPVFSVHYRF